MCEEHFVSFFNGQKMPIIGLGTWMSSPNEVEKAVDIALEVGYRHIDTALMYQNEEAIGNTLKKWFDSGKIKREDVFVVTKLPPKGNRAEAVEKYLKKSLDALQLDYVDLYLIHAPFGLQDIGEDFWPKDPSGALAIDPNTNLISLWKAMEIQVDAGRARSIGLSNCNSNQIGRILKEARVHPANLQVELHVLFQQKKLVEFCKSKNITVCAYAPLGSPGYRSDPEIDPLNHPLVCRIALLYNKTPAQILLRHIIQKGIVVIPKSVTASRIKENFEVFDFELSKDEMDQLNALDKGSDGRKFTMSSFQGLSSHPEFPYNIPY